MQIDIPDNIYNSFLGFLDVAQYTYTEDEVANFTDDEKAVIKFIETLLGDKLTKRYKTQEDFLKGVQETFAENTKDALAYATKETEEGKSTEPNENLN